MKHDINSQNTKRMLANTLITLLEKKPIAKITVSEIVSLCEINRKTFYYHFEDVYDLFEWHIQQEMQNAIELMNPLNDINATITYAVSYMREHNYLRNCIASPVGRDKIVRILNNALYSQIQTTMLELETLYDKNLDSDFKEFLIKNITRITVLSIIDAIENPDAYDVERLQRYVSVLFRTSIEGVFLPK